MTRAGKALVSIAMASLPVIAVHSDVRTTDSAWTFPRVATRAEWETRAADMRRTILFRAGLWPAPPRTPLNAQVFGRIARSGFTVEKAYFESLPGFYVTGTLYRPAAGTAGGSRAPFPAILAPHGHAAYGRLPTVRVGIARDPAFGFYHADDIDALKQAGAEPVFFSPIADAQLPEVDALFLGGGFPECFMRELEANRGCAHRCVPPWRPACRPTPNAAA